MAYFLLTSQENKGVFFVRILRLFMSTWRLFDFLHLHYVYKIYVCVEVQRGVFNGRLFFTVVSLAIPSQRLQSTMQYTCTYTSTTDNYLKCH